MIKTNIDKVSNIRLHITNSYMYCVAFVNRLHVITVDKIVHSILTCQPTETIRPQLV